MLFILFLLIFVLGLIFYFNSSFFKRFLDKIFAPVLSVLRRLFSYCSNTLVAKKFTTFASLAVLKINDGVFVVCNVAMFRSLRDYFKFQEGLIKNDPNVVFSTFFGAGFFKAAPGTFASFVTVVLALIFHYISPTLNLIFFVIVLIGGFYSSKKMVQKYKVTDPSYIVIDEVAGQLIPMLLFDGSIYYAISVFLLFRFFDITKLSIIGVVERSFKDYKGIMLDDLISGIFALFTILFLDFIL